MARLSLGVWLVSPHPLAFQAIFLISLDLGCDLISEFCSSGRGWSWGNPDGVTASGAHGCGERVV
ncbi:hypothetical protein Poly21_18990 [Allorhodopirellula heiligendammensis]|uniref:Uncharacterized protein n=1 Tax=Allorhodopirellula heiligendammensis TaxID=2714739 RepID=A0A5C6C8P3_9BACT|nr:hypothetical protein Poly21_18990 [Allorhodopirellula heiligendammensis]